MAWHYADLERRLDAFVGPLDSSDPKTQKRLRIVQAATERFMQQGYRKTSVDEVASRAGVAKGTVYLYFKTKIDLLLTAIAMEKREHLSRIRPVFVEDMEPRERLKRWLSSVLVLAVEMPLTSRLLRGDQELTVIMREMPRALMEENDQIRLEFVGGMVDAAAGPHHWNRMELEDRVRVLTGLAWFAGMLANPEVRGGMSVERYATILAEMVVDGISPRRNAVSKESSS